MDPDKAAPVIELLTQDGLQPFLWATGAVLGLLLLEVVLHFFGASSEIGGDADARPDTNLLDGPVEGDGATNSLLDLLGLRSVPLAVWLALLAATFAGAGLALQMVLHGTTGWLLGPRIAALLAAPPAVLATSRLSGLVGRLLPRETSVAISERSFGRRFGNVTVGTARAGHPAQVRFTDQHGNLHYLMAEPRDPADEFREGARVLILRDSDGRYCLARVES